MAENKKELKQLLEGFYSKAEAESFSDDLDLTDALLDSSSVTGPDPETINQLKSQVSQELNKSRHHRKLLYMSATAAAIVFATIISSVFLRQPDMILNQSPVSSAASASFSIWNTDESSQLENMKYEINELEDKMLQVRLDETSDEAENFTADIEEELIEVCGTFWKG